MSLIIFDFDGTIADSFQYVLHFLAGEAHQQILPEAEGDYLSLSMKDMAHKLGIPLWRLPYVYFKGRRVMRDRIIQVPPFAGMPEVLRDLHANGYQLAIVSSNSSRNIKKFLRHHDLDQLISAVRGGAGILGKAGVIRQLQRRFKVGQSWYVGDETTDVISAQAAEALALAVSWGFADRRDLEHLEPTAIVDDPAQILVTIKAYGK